MTIVKAGFKVSAYNGGTMISRLALHRTATAITVMLLAMAVLWWSLWMIGAAQYRNFIDGWIAAHEPQGWHVTYDARDTEGFPRHIILHFTNFVLQNPDGVKIHAGEVALATLPWQWRSLDAKLKHGFDLVIPFGEGKMLFIATSETARSHTELDQNGDWSFVNLQLENAKALWGAKPFFSADNFFFSLARPETPPQNYKEAGIDFHMTVDAMTLPDSFSSPFGLNAEKIDLALRVLGPVPDPRVKESVATWNEAGGAVAFDKLDLKWGPLVLAAKGTLALDDDLQPEGAFSSQIGNHGKVMKALIDADYIPKHEELMLGSALDLFAKHVDISGTPGIEVPIAVQLGGLFLGPVKVFEYPEIIWGAATPAAPAGQP